MSVPGLGPVGLDLATLLRLSGHGPLAAGSAAEIAQATSIQLASVQAASIQQDVSAADLSLLGPGEAPSDASIGLYTAELGDPTGIAQETEATARTLQDTFDAIKIDDRVAEVLSQAIQSTVAEDAINLLKAVEDGDAAKAAALAEKLSPGLASLNETAANPSASASAVLGDQPALAARLQGLVAAAQSGDMTGAAALARTIGTQVQAALPSESLPPSLMQLLAPATGLPLPGAEVNPMLMAMQLSLMLSARSTLERLRKLREDRLKILAIAPFAPLEEDKARESE